MRHLCLSCRFLSLAFTLALLMLVGPFLAHAETKLPVGGHPAPIAASHFPSRMHAFVWRNWGLVSVERLAELLETEPGKVTGVALSMGLPEAGPVDDRMREKGYITLVRRNWHLLPYDQLLKLLDITAEELYARLLEDDFLYTKLGRLKPKCEALKYHEPTAAEQARAGEIKRLIEKQFRGKFTERAEEERFAFIDRLSKLPAGYEFPEVKTKDTREEPLRFIYSYFGSYGDPLLSAELDPYPDGLLARLREVGVNGVWLHVVLRNMAPGGEAFPEFGKDHETRLKHLRSLCQRAERFGIKVYLYMNEPRAIEEGFFKNRPEMGGVKGQGMQAMCTSDPRVRKWLSDSLTHVFKTVPELGGVFTISASENLTSCWSHGRGAQCPRCSKRTGDDVIAEVNQLIEQGVHRGNPKAKVLVWDWGWHGHGEAGSIIRKLPKGVSVMSVSEWSKPITRGGVKTHVGEYSVSAVGPGPRAKGHWKVAKEQGLGAVAKMQINTTWELSAVPYVPALYLVAEHCRNLQKQEVDGQMLSWTVGGYPSPNLMVAHAFAKRPHASVHEVLTQVSEEYYGRKPALELRKAWADFSAAFSEYPYHISVLYNGPQQMGPANLLYAKPTNYRSTMVGIPYDHLDGWRGPYPEEVFIEQFEKVAKGWEKGIERLRIALIMTDETKRERAERDYNVAAAAGIHFQSVANQARFIHIRNKTKNGLEGLSDEERKLMRELVLEEMQLAVRLWVLTRKDSRIGFEASNHYYYVPNDLGEKVINGAFILKQLTD